MEFTQEVQKATDPIYQKISKVMPEIEWSVHAPYIHKINELKKKKNAVILAHNYQTPEIYHGVADFAADSLALAIEASKTSADIILMAGVHFMAETAKLMSPDKKVMMVTECSMSDNIQVENPNVEFIRPCNLCPHMKKITLPKILDCLENETGEIIMDKEMIEKAKIPVERMALIGR